MLNIFGRRDRCEAVVEFDQAVSQPSVHYRTSQQQHTLPVSKSQLEEKYHRQSRQEHPPPPIKAYLWVSVFITEVTKQAHLLFFYVHECDICVHMPFIFLFLPLGENLFFKRYCINKGIVIIIILFLQSDFKASKSRAGGEVMCSCIAQLELGGFCVKAEFYQCTKEFFFPSQRIFSWRIQKIGNVHHNTKQPCSQGTRAIRVVQFGKIWKNS